MVCKKCGAFLLNGRCICEGGDMTKLDELKVQADVKKAELDALVVKGDAMTTEEVKQIVILTNAIFVIALQMLVEKGGR